LTNNQCDLLVIGGGTAGLVAAKTAAGFNAQVLLVERDRPGGDCLWTGCVPSKSLIAAASAAARIRESASIGIHASEVRIDFGEVMKHVHEAIRTIEPADSFDSLRAVGVHVIAGDAMFVDPDTVRINGEQVRFRQALVATGATPVVPDIPGLSDIDFFTSENIWNLTHLPQRLAVLGGGAISCELGQAFARLGARVTIVTRSQRLLEREDPEAARVVIASILADGVEVVTEANATGITATGTAGAGTLRLEDGQEVAFDALLVATGRSPRTQNLGLAAAGIDTDDDGHVVVDDHLQTTNPWVWAAGDVTGRSHHTHTAGVHGSLAASNAVLGLKRTISTSAVPRVTFTSPELAAVGVSTDPGRVPDGGQMVDWSHAELDRAVTQDERSGVTRLAIDRKGRIVGATVVSPRAGETLGELSLAIHHGMRTRDVASVTHAYPTYNDAVWNAAVRDVRRSLTSGMTSRAIGLLRSVRRLWVRWHQERR
jgi:pyruvate/2-oxoglutarate dehydrogenase complex dihydrolipoamide dehydrogenase (E3) component